MGVQAMKLLWVGDAGCPSGFARATHEILDTLHRTFDVTVLGINYRGDPHAYPYPIFAAMPGGDFMGIGRLVWMCDYVKPDIIVIQNDGWNIPEFVAQVRRFQEFNHVPIVASVAVDGKNFARYWLDGVAHTIFWTKFAQDEARRSGFKGLSTVIPLGVDTSTYHPMDKKEALTIRGIEKAGDAFIVGSVNRNQVRKRWDLLIRYFADWVLTGPILDAYLFLHAAPTGDTGVKVRELAAYYGVMERLILVEPPVWYGVDESMLAATYNCFDVSLSTTQGEGFGLTTLEAMACGVPCIVPKWSALGDWAAEAALMVSCPTTCIGPPYVNVIGGVADQKETVEALDLFYRDRDQLAHYSAKSLILATQPRYQWKRIGEQYDEVLQRCCHESQDARHRGDGKEDAGLREAVPGRGGQGDLSGSRDRGDGNEEAHAGGHHADGAASRQPA
jgi:D-inositol-3-phosphate glycosyltransferase